MGIGRVVGGWCLGCWEWIGKFVVFFEVSGELFCSVFLLNINL